MLLVVVSPKVTVSTVVAITPIQLMKHPLPQLRGLYVLNQHTLAAQMFFSTSWHSFQCESTACGALQSTGVCNCLGYGRFIIDGKKGTNINVAYL